MKNKSKIIIGLTALVTLTLYIINRIHFYLADKSASITNSTSYEYDWRFGKINYYKTGSGSPLLLIHDLIPGSSSYEFSQIINTISKDREVYSIDLLGYGLSEKPDMTYTNYCYVQLIIDFIKTVIGKKTDIMATGDSTSIALMACHNDPEAVGKLILINPQSLYNSNQIPSKQTKLLKWFINIPILGTFIFNLFSSQNIIEESFKNDYFYNSEKIKSEFITTYYKNAHIPDYRAKYPFASYIGKYTNANILHALKETNNSIFIIVGEEKPDVQTITENYLYYNASVEIAYMKESKHLPHMENPAAFMNQIELYLH